MSGLPKGLGERRFWGRGVGGALSLFRFHLSPFPLETPDTQARICIYLWQISSSAIFVTIWLFLHSIYTLSEGDVRVCGVAFLHNFWCGFAVIFILSCGIAVLQNQAVCSICKFSGNFNAVRGFRMLFWVVSARNDVQFCGIRRYLNWKCEWDGGVSR